jgi:hypothetical protein
LRIRSDDAVEEVVNTSTGEMNVRFSEEHKDAAGERLVIPGLFCITIPIFHKGAAYRLPCRLLYRKQGARIAWKYEILNHERALEHAIQEMSDKVEADTGVPIFFGDAPAIADIGTIGARTETRARDI